MPTLKEKVAAAAKTSDQPKKPTFHRSPDFKTLYVNFVQSGMTAFDVSLIVGENHGVDEKGEGVIELKAKLTMTPLEAKLVAAILADSVKRHEKQFGEISVPPGLITIPPET
jgi:hypothetical protein